MEFIEGYAKKINIRAACLEECTGGNSFITLCCYVLFGFDIAYCTNSAIMVYKPWFMTVQKMKTTIVLDLIFFPASITDWLQCASAG